MTKTIYKYEIPVTDTAVVTMPRWAEILKIGEQNNDLFLWAIVDPGNDPINRVFYVRGTGHPMTGYEGSYLGTVQMRSGLVWHVFDPGVRLS